MCDETSFVLFTTLLKTPAFTSRSGVHTPCTILLEYQLKPLAVSADAVRDTMNSVWSHNVNKISTQLLT